MAKTIEMLVGLKIPDTTAITALQTLQKMGFSKITELKRFDYYKFLVEGDEKKFMEKTAKADIIVNANKHSFSFSVPEDGIRILVKNIDYDTESMVSALRKSFGLSNLKKVEKGIMWSMKIDADEKEARKIAQEAAEQLLVNRHYQEYIILN